MVQFRLGWVWFVWFSLGWVWFVQFGGLVSKGLVWFSLVQFGLVWVGFGSVRVRFGLFGSASQSPRAQSVSHLLWPAQPRAGSRAPRPSHWPRPPCGSGALGTAGCSGTRMLWWQERNTASIRNHIPNPSAALLGSWDTQISGTASPEPAGAPGSILAPSGAPGSLLPTQELLAPSWFHPALTGALRSILAPSLAPAKPSAGTQGSPRAHTMSYRHRREDGCMEGNWRCSALVNGAVSKLTESIRNYWL